MSDLSSYTGQSCDWYDLPCHLTSFANWLLNVLLYVPRKTWELLLDGLATVFEAIPALPALEQVSGLMTAIAGFGYAADLAALKPGLALVMTALLARFLLRRIPLIG